MMPLKTSENPVTSVHILLAQACHVVGNLIYSSREPMVRIRGKGIFGSKSFTFTQTSPSSSSYMLQESGEGSRKISLTNTILESPLHPKAQSFVTASSLFFLFL